MKITEDTRTNKVTLAVFTSTLRRTGLTIPPTPTPMAASLPTRDDVTAAAVKVMREGKDPAADAEVQRLVTGLHIAEAGISARLELEDSKAALQHIADHAPALLEELAEQFNEAVDIMRDAIPTTGHADLSAGVHFTPGTSTGTVMAMARAAEALHAATVVADTWATFMDAAGENTRARHQPKLWYCQPTWEQYDTHQLRWDNNSHGRQHNLWDMLNDGIHVDLALSANEHQERVEQLETEQQEAQREAAKAERERKNLAY